MKPKSAPRHGRSKSHGNLFILISVLCFVRALLSGSGQSLNIFTGGSQPTAKSRPRRTQDSVQSRPLRGRVFYLDLPNNKRTAVLENDIAALGGTVEKFFSKEIRYLVSSRPEARHAQRLVASPEPAPSSPFPARCSSQGNVDTVQVSRGKSLVEKVVKEQERIQMNGILSNAMDLGVKILYIDDMMAYVERKKASLGTVQKGANSIAIRGTSSGKPDVPKTRTSRIRKPFIKVEDSSRLYRPLYLSLARDPVLNFAAAPPLSPFITEGKGAEGHLGKGKSRVDGKERKRGGYCECCGVKYDNLKVHLHGKMHQAFVASDQYQVVDELISQLPCNFVYLSPGKSWTVSSTQHHTETDCAMPARSPPKCLTSSRHEKRTPDFPSVPLSSQNKHSSFTCSKLCKCPMTKDTCSAVIDVKAKHVAEFGGHWNRLLTPHAQITTQPSGRDCEMETDDVSLSVQAKHIDSTNQWSVNTQSHEELTAQQLGTTGPLNSPVRDQLRTNGHLPSGLKDSFGKMDQESVSLHSPGRPWRKVRSVKMRRTGLSHDRPAPSSLTMKVLESNTASMLKLCQLFQSSDDMQEFKGFSG
ncbi:protein DBF4 homolog A isoform X1 [Denticeps clupeoides]|uniref:protein DBF4 homolog A isoform X1 n=1 Tax=Denticeps clupeoides TaxID=299321 RepID=UPI0010A3C768|nr:protein DBF4 homolog A isoform X1 [Denticeps clupeoides]XP_028833843.1 protein DBF4 homolog A isoform X1 [Denticeps clupeoides]